MRKSKAERFLEAFGDIDDKYLEEAMNYTMKKKFNFKPIIAAAACLVLAVTAYPMAKYVGTLPGTGVTETTENATAPENKLGASGNFAVYESGVHSGALIGTHKVELNLNHIKKRYMDEEKKGKNQTITFNGETWTASYEYSWDATDFSDTLDRYQGISNGKKVTFAINPKTGRCEYFFFGSTDDIDKTVKLTRDELYAIASEYFYNGGYTSDPENYQLSDEGNNGAAGYWFCFSRYVDGVETADRVRIGLRNNGDFYWYVENNIGEMKNVDISAIDFDKFYSLVEAKLKAIYADAYVGYDKNGMILTPLTDGSYIFDYCVSTNVKDNNGKVISDSCYLTIVID